jgi:DNA-directed RNA polymerase specialized sigma24 family protein
MERESKVAAAEIAKFRFCRAIAEDMLQETLLKLHLKKKASGLEVGQEQLTWGWIKTVARNLCLDHVKKEARGRKTLGSFRNEIEEREYFCQNEDFEHQEALALKVNCVKELLTAQQNSKRTKIATEYYMNQKSLCQLVQEFQIPQNTVLSHLCRFRREIRKEMGTENFFESRNVAKIQSFAL